MNSNQVHYLQSDRSILEFLSSEGITLDGIGGTNEKPFYGVVSKLTDSAYKLAYSDGAELIMFSPKTFYKTFAKVSKRFRFQFFK